MKKTTREQCEEVIAARVETLVTRWQAEKTQEEKKAHHKLNERMDHWMKEIAKEESRAISANVKWGYARKFEKGESTRQRSYGFRKAPTGEMCIVEEEAAVIRNMARWFLDGDSLERIKQRLEDAGIETTTGKKTWSTGTIYNILTNEKIMGDVLLQKTFTADYLTKRRVKNSGQQKQYYGVQ